MAPNNIIISEVLKSDSAVTTEEGQAIFKIIDHYFQKNENVVLDFSNLRILISTFLNASIGQLYINFDKEFIKSHLDLINISQEDLHTIKEVTDSAKRHSESISKIGKEDLEEILKKHFPDGDK